MQMPLPAAPTHIKIPTEVFGMMMNTLAALPYGQVAQLMGEVQSKMEPVFTSETTLDSSPGVVVKSSNPSAAQPPQTENRDDEHGQRSDPQPA